MVDCVLLNSGGKILLNNGTSCVLLNEQPAGVQLPSDVPVSDLRGIGSKKKRNVYKYSFELIGRVVESSKLPVEGKVSQRVTFNSLSKIFHENLKKTSGRVFVEGTKLYVKSRVMVHDYKLREDRKKELKKIWQEFKEEWN